MQTTTSVAHMLVSRSALNEGYRMYSDEKQINHQASSVRASQGIGEPSRPSAHGVNVPHVCETVLFKE